VRVDPQGRVYFAYQCAGGNCGIASLGVARFDAAGLLDPTFGERGLAVWSDGRDRPGFFNDYEASAIWPAADGSLTVVFRHTSGGGRAIVFDYATRAIRFDPSGALVTSFANDLQIGHAVSGVTQLDDGGFLQVDYANGSCSKVVRKLGDRPKVGATLVEYEYKGRYFITAEGLESAILDAEPASERLTRTNRRFGGWSSNAGLAGTLPMCRFTGDGTAGPRGHFYALQGAECDVVRADDVRLPAGTRTWRFEGLTFAETPVGANGACPANLQPVRRLFNDGFRRGIDPNHRFVTDPAVVVEMQAAGWILEGQVFCAPPGGH